MAATTLTLPTGSKIRTQSTRRYVVVAEYSPGKPVIEYRTDDLNRAITRQAKIGLRAVVVDTVGRKVRTPFRPGAKAEWVEA